MFGVPRPAGAPKESIAEVSDMDMLADSCSLSSCASNPDWIRRRLDGQVATVNIQHGASDEAGIVRDQERSCRCNF